MHIIRRQHGDDLVVRATFSDTTVLPQWRAGIKIETHLGHPAFTVDRRHTGTICPQMHGSATAEWRLKDLRLGGGLYFVHVFLAETNGDHIVIQREAASFRVADEDTQSGIAWTATTMRQLL
jgi:ABC-2 type transport system ATP-binding protein